MGTKIKTWDGTVPGQRKFDGKIFGLASGPLTKAEAAYYVLRYRTGWLCRTVRYGRHWYLYTHAKLHR